MRTTPGGHDFDTEEYDPTAIDIWALRVNFCNGPRCKDCNKNWCHHHNPEIYTEKCPSIIEAAPEPATPKEIAP